FVEIKLVAEGGRALDEQPRSRARNFLTDSVARQDDDFFVDTAHVRLSSKRPRSRYRLKKFSRRPRRRIPARLRRQDFRGAPGARWSAGRDRLLVSRRRRVPS